MDTITYTLHITNPASPFFLPEDPEFDEFVSLSYIDHLGTNPPEHSTTGDMFVFPDSPHEYEVFKSAVDYTLDCLNGGDR